ncbi:hypothetical protein AB0392_02775 [Nonomuraea angiospora]|uniref:hypothetical protein n=1 Tax=Nonomuraea angiospora TaxID=46172 RepID=UPI00344CCB3E
MPLQAFCGPSASCRWVCQAAIDAVLIGLAGVHGRRGGKPTWGPPAHAALRRLIADRTPPKAGR